MTDIINQSKINTKLKEKKVWVNWKLTERDGKKTKTPFQSNGNSAKVNDPLTWNTYENVFSAKDRFSGIGTMFDGTIFGIDLDKVVVNGEIVDEKTKELVDRWNGYIEFSPSGTGLHFLAFLKEGITLKRNKNNTGKITESGNVEYEAYVGGRYFTYTENMYPTSTNEMRTMEKEEVFELLDLLDIKKDKAPVIEKEIPEKKIEDKPESESMDKSIISDEMVLEKSLSKESTLQFYFLNDESKNEDKSRADMSLMCSFAYFTGGNREQMKRIFINSPRGKREKVSVRKDYIEKLLNASLNRVKDYHDWNNINENTPDYKKFQVKKLSELYKEPDEETQWLLEGIFPLIGNSIIIAKPKVGKSIFTRNLCHAVATGSDFLGRKTKQGVVLYISLEESETAIKKHFREMGSTAENIFICANPGNTLKDSTKWINEQIEIYKPNLIVIDTIFRFVSILDINDYANITKILNPIIELSKNKKVHFMLVHHARKGDGDVGDSTLGSTAIFGTVDTNLIIKKTKDGLMIETSQRYGESIPETYITLNSNKFFTVSETKIERSTKNMSGEIVDLLKRNPDGLIQQEIVESIYGDTNTKKNILKEMTNNGLLIATGRGVKGSPLKYYIQDSTIYSKSGNTENIEYKKEDNEEIDSENNLDL